MKGNAFLKIALLVVLCCALVSATAAATEHQALGKSEAHVNGKPCEVLRSAGSDRTEWMLNPALDSYERQTCVQTLQHQGSHHLPPYDYNSVLVKLEPRSKASRIQALGTIGTAKHIRAGWIKVQFGKDFLSRPGDAVSTAMETLRNQPGVEIVEPNYIFSAQDSPGTWGVEAIGAREAQSVVSCSLRIGIAILDTGVNPHQEFVGLEGDPDDNGHGTHVASSAVGSNVGVCPGGKIISYKVLDAAGEGTADAIAGGIISATNDSDVKIISMSLSGRGDSALIADAIADAIDAGKLVIAASGNDLGEGPAYPAAYPGVISVGAHDSNFRLTYWSARAGGKEDGAIVAPGSRIVGADYATSDGYLLMSGTSMACPHVAGAAALVWSENPTLTSDQVKSVLLGNAIPIGDRRDYGEGLLNVAAALNSTEYSVQTSPISLWLLPWPTSVHLNETIQVRGKFHDINDDSISGSATIEAPSGISSTLQMSYNSELGMWETSSYLASELGTFTATVEACDSSGCQPGFGYVNFAAIDRVYKGWPQHGKDARGGSWISSTIVITSGVQIYNSFNRTSASTDEATVLMDGSPVADMPEAVMIVSTGGCAFGNGYGRRSLYDLDLGMYKGYNDPYSTTIEMECQEGIGMFANTAGSSGMYYMFDQGSGSSHSDDARLHRVDPTGKHYWLTQLSTIAGGHTKVSQDGLRVYVTSGPYEPLWAVNAMTGERLWLFDPGGASTEAAPIEVGDKVIVKVNGGSSTGVYALDAKSGAQLWRYGQVASLTGKSLPAAAPDGTILVCDNQSRIHALNGNGQRIWLSQALGSSYCDSTPAIIGSKYIFQVAVTSTVPMVNLLDLDTGELVESAQLADYGTAWSSPVGVGNVVFVGNYRGRMLGYTVPDLDIVFERDVGSGGLVNWQLSAFEKEDTIVVEVANNSGYHQGWEFEKTGESYNPTAVNLAHFGAVPDGDVIRVEWETAMELNNVGFNLYRSEASDGGYARLNETLILSQSPGSVSGAAYMWMDEDVQPGVTYYYKLEDIEVGGARTLHGPVSTSTQGPTAISLTSFRARRGNYAAAVLVGSLLLGLNLLSYGKTRREKERGRRLVRCPQAARKESKHGR